MEAVRERWTDDRMDDLNHKVDELARRMDTRFIALEARMDLRFDATDARLDSMQRTMVHGFVAMTAAILAGFGGMAGLIATQL